VEPSKGDGYCLFFDFNRRRRRPVDTVMRLPSIIKSGTKNSASKHAKNDDGNDDPEDYRYNFSTASTLRQRDDVIMHGLLTFGVVSFDGLCV
jgi:hypothetical protein